MGRDQLGPMHKGFQSSPFPKEGRYVTLSLEQHAQYLFQSSPFPKEGRYGANTRAR
ncbi:MAG: hypothetical protein OJF47_004079 [Nitrospira sp.]|nr:MAG: hypothetical protein OJF47_004079 [Nitrospira sp.]